MTLTTRTDCTLGHIHVLMLHFDAFPVLKRVCIYRLNKACILLYVKIVNMCKLTSYYICIKCKQRLRCFKYLLYWFIMYFS